MFQSVLNLINSGGPIMGLLLLIAILIWSLIIERYHFIYWIYPKKSVRLNEWPTSWLDKKIQQAEKSQLKLLLTEHFDLLSALINICPLMGLLGTVIGMIEIFDAVALNQISFMADGIAKATLPTLTGMSIALSSLYFNRQLKSKVDHLIHQMNI